ncbi:MAG: BON domain-containing protein [Xanthomonadales bacterium]
MTGEPRAARRRRNAVRTMLASATVLAVALALAACGASPERRTFGTFIDDQAAEVKIIDQLYSRPEFDERDHIKVEAHNRTLLLAGETSSAEKKALATRVAAELKAIDRVVNELAVMPPADLSDKTANSYITSKVNTRLALSNPIEGREGGRIKVMTARGIVYLMGSVTRAEGDAVADSIRDIRGVVKVVKVFDYID